MRIVVGTENGPIKVYTAENTALLASVDIGEKRSAVALLWAVPDKVFLAVLSDGRVVRVVLPERAEGAVAVELCAVRAKSICKAFLKVPASDDALMVFESGAVWRLFGVLAETEVKLEEGAEIAREVLKVNAPVACAAVDCWDFEDGEESTVEVVLAVGGKKNDVQVWRLDKGEVAWKAAPRKPDTHTRQPDAIWPTGILFSPKNTRVLYVGTSHKEIRIYDTLAVSRRPTFCQALVPHPVQCVSTVCDKEQQPTEKIAFGTTGGEIMVFDPEKKQLLGAYRGSAGSVRGCYVVNGVLCSVGIDRFVRVFNEKSRFLVSKAYIKQLPSCMLVTEERWNPKRDEERKTDELWESLAEKPFEMEEKKKPKKRVHEAVEDDGIHESAWERRQFSTATDPRRKKKRKTD